MKLLTLALIPLAVLGAAPHAQTFAQTPPAGDAARGKALYETRCGICHALDENKLGPKHRGVVGRKAGSVAGFDYSPGFAKKSDLVWTEKNLDAWIAAPENIVPGQKMGFYVVEPDVRADIIAWLKLQTVKADAPK
jgi:cytochrome c